MNKKYIIVLSVLGVLFGVSLLVGISYAYYMVSVSQTNKNVIKSSCLNLSISNEENVIRLEKQIPIINEEGKKLTPYTFTINNTCNSMMGYSLNLEELEGSTLASKYIMTMVNDKSYVNMASLSSTDNYYDSSVESRVLATGSLGPNASINYSLRLWMDEATPMTTDAMNKSFRSKVVVVATPTKSVDFDYTGTEQTFIVPQTGTYKVELWGAGASADNSTNILKNTNGLGAYVSGNIYLDSKTNLTISVGSTNGYNGGGLGEATGGGATDIRLQSRNLYSRIIVAGGGGGAMHAVLATPKTIGHAGGLKGYDADAIMSNNSQTDGFSGYGGTQIAGGNTGVNGKYEYNVSMNGSFGQGGQYINADVYRSSGGGGGWYGGGHGRHTGNSWPGGGGGSSYISGHSGCLAVSSSTSTELKNGCTENSTSLECSISYTGYYFTDTVMIDGAGYKWTTQKGEYTGMPSHDGTGTMKGNAGNGYARITYIG